VLEQRPASFSWRALTEGGRPSLNELRGFIEVHPVLDFKSLQPGREAEDEIRRAASPIAVRDHACVRLTGPVVINDEQFGSIRENAIRNAVITAALVLLVLWLALRSVRLVGALCMNVLIGLAATAAAGSLLVGAVAAVADKALPIYLLHYAPVVWMQYVLLDFALRAVAKGVIVFVCALAISWGLAAGAGLAGIGQSRGGVSAHLQRRRQYNAENPSE
jgi:hypothetical protein